MRPLRALTIAGVVGAASLGSGLFEQLIGETSPTASAQTLMSRSPSMLAAPNNYSAPPSYNSMPMQYAAHGGMSAYPANGYGAAQPTNGYTANYAQYAPQQYQPSFGQPVWPYVQSSDGQSSVMLGRSELLGGPPLSPPNVQLPTPAPTYSAPSYSAPSHSPPSYSAPQFTEPQHRMPMPQAPHAGGQMYGMPSNPDWTGSSQSCMMPGNPYAAAPCDVWSNGYEAMYCQPAPRMWFGSVGAMVMTLDGGDHYTFSFGTGNEADQRTNSRDADMNWELGYEVRVGRYFNCGQNAVEAVYWNINSGVESTQTTSADVLGQLNGILNWNDLNYGGAAAGTYVNVAPADDGIHRLTREYNFQNIELNLWQFRGPCVTGKCNNSRLRNNWLMGFRYFRFDENLLFASDANDLLITYADDEIFYNIDIENHLFGFQIGNEGQYCVTNRLSADFGIKLGVYANQINHVSEIGGNLGVATINNGPFIGREYYVASTKNDIAFLGELNLGLQYCFNHRWTGRIGYRALAVTGVAMAADQIYPDLRGINDVASIDSSRGIMLHGGYAGVEYNW